METKWTMDNTSESSVLEDVNRVVDEFGCGVRETANVFITSGLLCESLVSELDVFRFGVLTSSCMSELEDAHSESKISDRP